MGEDPNEALRQAMQPLMEYIHAHVLPALTRLDKAITAAGEAMADDAEDWLREVTK